MSRANYKFIRDNDHFTESREELPDWLKSFADKMATNESSMQQGYQTIVEQSRFRDAQANMFSYIDDLVNNKPRFATVHDKVLDLQERTGLKAYLNKISSKPSLKSIVAMINSASEEDNENDNNVTSDASANNYPKLFNKYPEIKYFINNTIKTQHGNIHVPAVINSIIEVYKNKGVTLSELRDDDLLNYINNIIAVEQKSNGSNNIQTDIGAGLGLNHNDYSEDNNDVFGFATPAS